MFMLRSVWWRKEKEKMGNRNKEQTSRNERTRSEEVIIRSRRGDKKKGAKDANKVRGGQFYHTPTRVSPIEWKQKVDGLCLNHLTTVLVTSSLHWRGRGGEK